MTEPQVWTLIGVFAAIMLGGLTLSTTLLGRVISAGFAAVDAKFDAVDAKFDAVNSKLEVMNDKIERLDREVGGISRHLFGFPESRGD